MHIVFLRAGFTYTRYKSFTNIQSNDIEQITPSLSIDLTDYWQVNLSTTQDFEESNRGTLFTDINVKYKDECFSFGLSGRRDLTRSSDTDEEGFSLLAEFELLGL